MERNIDSILALCLKYKIKKIPLIIQKYNTNFQNFDLNMKENHFYDGGILFNSISDSVFDLDFLQRQKKIKLQEKKFHI